MQPQNTRSSSRLTPAGRAHARRMAEAFADYEARPPAAEVRRLLAALDEALAARRAAGARPAAKPARLATKPSENRHTVVTDAC